MEHASYRPAALGDEGGLTFSLSHQAAVGAGSTVGGPALTRMLIDCMPWPAALVADDRAIAFANRRARACPVIATLSWQGLPPAGRGADPALIRALRQSLDDPDTGPVMLRIQVSGRALPVCVGVKPLPEPGLHGAQSLVTVHDPQMVPAVDRLLLTRMFGLTPAEARVAARLVEGQSLHLIAAESGNSLQTVRSQLQSVFDKLAVRRQSALVRMLLSLPPAISIPPNATAGD